MSSEASLGYLVREFGDEEVMSWGQLPDLALGDHEVAIDVAYAGVNFLDVHQRTGKYPRPLPFIPGNEGSGRVAAVGDGVVGLVPGDRVAFAMHGQGSYAQRVHVRADRVAAVPDVVGLSDAAGSILQGVTALCLVEEEARVAPGQTVLVHSASGGAGASIVQVARHAGAAVLALVSSEQKRQLALDAGAREVALYSDAAEYSTWVADLTGGAGASAVFDAVGGDLVLEDIRSLGPRGKVVLYGQTSGPFTPVPPGLLAARSLSVVYSRISAYIAEPGEFARLAHRLFELMGAGAFAPSNLTVREAADAAQAHRALTSRASLGKTVLRVEADSLRAD
ncbi:zinc-binding dehydrogenase [Microbacterium sp. zg.B48]|uniref:zinc-binding dehydrogenase n=1 Tax=Microbacterium sp. zg.B48 TaxID=2969408 RepID=UPI00214BE841|nr:zinc-binding dehydrogenase [Microbacterium sp. zg.B48]MCR2764335.1 zinc-binding dehydrogenase [Microbacterium sp. zg.B48]